MQAVMGTSSNKLGRNRASILLLALPMALFGAQAQASEQAPAREAKAKPEPTKKVVTGSVDVGFFADRRPNEDVASVSPLMTLGVRPREHVELGIGMGVATLATSDREFGNRREVMAGNLSLGTKFVHDELDRPVHTYIGFEFALPTNARMTDNQQRAFRIARAVRAGFDAWRFTPSSMAVVVPLGVSWQGRWLRVGADGAVAGLFAAPGNANLPGAVMQARGHAALVTNYVVAGASLSGVWNARETLGTTQAAAGPFAELPLCVGERRRASCPLSLTGRANINLDAPMGFASEGRRVWGMLFGLSWSLYEL